MTRYFRTWRGVLRTHVTCSSSPARTTSSTRSSSFRKSAPTSTRGWRAGSGLESRDVPRDAILRHFRSGIRSAVWWPDSKFSWKFAVIFELELLIERRFWRCTFATLSVASGTSSRRDVASVPSDATHRREPEMGGGGQGTTNKPRAISTCS